MKPDLYTKIVLTVIALALVMIACNQYANPKTSVSAQGPFAGVLPVAFGDTFVFFDARSGELWVYDGSSLRLQKKFRLTTLGQPLALQ
jgi:hypothetical protein